MMGKEEHLFVGGGSEDWKSHCKIQSGIFLNRMKVNMSKDPVIQILGIYIQLTPFLTIDVYL